MSINNSINEQVKFFINNPEVYKERISYFETTQHSILDSKNEIEQILSRELETYQKSIVENPQDINKLKLSLFLTFKSKKELDELEKAFLETSEDFNKVRNIIDSQH